jgi:predicted ATP-grasp superfamily ATP-dependent carboligase
MRILFNHHISGAADTIELMRRSRSGLFVIATHERADTPIRLTADRFLPEPASTKALSPDAYADWLLGVAVEEGAGLVIPYRRRDELARFRDRFAERGVLLLTAANEQTMRVLENKPDLLQRLERLGVPITPFYLFKGLSEYKRLRSVPLLFPDYPGDLCVKPASGIYGSGFRILRERIAERTPLSDLSTLEVPEAAFRATLEALTGAEEMMLMPLMPGQERSVDFACLDGLLLGTTTRVKTLTSQRIYHDQLGEDLAGLVARTFGLSGVLNLQTIEDASGTQRLLEVNSRTSGGIGMTGLTNVNLPALLLNALEGSFPSAPKRVESPVVAARREIFWAT